MNISSNEHYKTDEFSCTFLTKDHFLDSVNDINPAHINVSEASFVSIITHHSVYYNHLRKIKKWNKPTLTFNPITDWGFYDIRSPLHIACQVNNIECVKRMIQDPCININEPAMINKRLTAPIYMAADNKYWEIVKILLKTKKVNMSECMYKKANILFLAGNDNQIEVIELILDYHVC